jgi:hypothetical protein
MSHSELNLRLVVARAFQSPPALPLLDEMGPVCMATLCGGCVAYSDMMGVRMITAYFGR